MNETGIKDELNYDIQDFSDLSILELITLQLLSRHKEPIVRHSLFMEVQQFFQKDRDITLKEDINVSSSEQKFRIFTQNRNPISTSSFYNNLKNLEKKGLLSFKDKGNIRLIEANELTKTVEEVIFHHFFVTRMPFEVEAMIESGTKILNTVGKEKFESFLLIWLYDNADLSFFRLLSTLTDSFFILCEEELYNNTINKSIETIKYSRVFNDLIREPDNAFECVFITYLDKKSGFHGINRSNLLKEAIRVGRKGGFIIVSNYSELPKTKNYVTNSLVKIYNTINNYQISNKDQLEEDMRNAGLSKITILEVKGFIFGIGWIE
jgi:hypothetical protein